MEKGADKWKDIPGYEGTYQVSHAGQIRRITQMKPGILAQIEKQGVMIVRLTDRKGNRKEQRVAHLVAAAWLGAKPIGAVIVHKNRIRTDNCAANLGYMNRSDWGRLTGADAARRPVVKKSLSGEILAHYRSARRAAIENHFSYQAIIDRCNGKLKRPPKDAIYEWEE